MLNNLYLLISSNHSVVKKNKLVQSYSEIINTEDEDIDALWLSNWDGSTTTNKVMMHFDSSGIGGYNVGMPAATDSFVIEDAGGNSSSWRTYRQALRDITNSPDNPTWPTKPS